MSDTPASDAIYLVKRLGVSDAREYVGRMPLEPRWNAVRDILSRLDPRQSRDASIKRILRLKVRLR